MGPWHQGGDSRSDSIIIASLEIPLEYPVVPFYCLHWIASGMEQPDHDDAGSYYYLHPSMLQSTIIQSDSTCEICDASTKAYTAVVYLRLEYVHRAFIKFVAATWNCFLSVFLLHKLITSIQQAIENQINLEVDSLLCFMDSKVSLYWIQGYSQEQKQFTKNWMKTICSLVKGYHWFHHPGVDNPADIPSRGMMTCPGMSCGWMCHCSWQMLPLTHLSRTNQEMKQNLKSVRWNWNTAHRRILTAFLSKQTLDMSAS